MRCESSPIGNNQEPHQVRPLIAVADESAVCVAVVDAVAAIHDNDAERLGVLLRVAGSGALDVNARLRLRLPLGRVGWDTRSSTLLGAAFTSVLNGAPSGACVCVLFEHGANGELFEDDQELATDGTLAFHWFECATVESFLDAYSDDEFDSAAGVEVRGIAAAREACVVDLT